jgi:microcin C transport system permease protein
MERASYFIRRLLLVIPTLLVITILCFAISQLVPGGPVEQMIQQMRGGGAGGESGPVTAGASGGISEKQREEIRKHFEFDKPILVRYWHWLVRDRVGLRRESFLYKKPAWEVIRQRLPVSLTFGLTGFVLSYLVCIPLGIGKALRNGGPFDIASSVVVFIGYSIPAFALGMLLKMFFSGTVEGLWNVFPVGGFHSDNLDALPFTLKVKDIFLHMFLPLVCYVAGSFAVLTLMMKNSLLDQVSADYVRTVYAKGGSTSRAIWGHALRNALIPIATGFGSIFTVMFAGSVIIERLFDIPGMGRLSLEAITNRDYGVFMCSVVITSFFGLLGNVLSDFCYVLIDPRIDFER